MRTSTWARWAPLRISRRRWARHAGIETSSMSYNPTSCPPVASHKLTLVVPGESQPGAFSHNRETSWQEWQEVTRSVARAPTRVASTPTRVARVTTSALRAPSSDRWRQVAPTTREPVSGRRNCGWFFACKKDAPPGQLFGGQNR